MGVAAAAAVQGAVEARSALDAAAVRAAVRRAAGRAALVLTGLGIIGAIGAVGIEIGAVGTEAVGEDTVAIRVGIGGTGAIIDPDSLPKGPNLLELEEKLPYQTSFGEDYELLFTAPKHREGLLRQLSIRHKVKLTRIGTITRLPKEGSREQSVRLKDCDWPPPLFSHFTS